MTNVNDIIKVITKLHHQFEDDELLKSCYKIILTKHSSWTAKMRKVGTFFKLGELGKEYPYLWNTFDDNVFICPEEVQDELPYSFDSDDEL